jgi:hypothetical protein
LRLPLRLNDSQSFESATVKAAIAGQESVGLNQGVGSDEQVRHHSEARGAALAPELTPELSGLRGGIIENRLEADAQEFHGVGKLRIVLEMCANFSPDDLASHERSSVVRRAQSLARPLPVNGVSAQNIQ